MPKNDKSSVNMSDSKQVQPFLVRCHIDLPLLLGLLMTLGMSLFVLYSASGQHVEMLERQIIRTSLAFLAMIFVAQIPPKYLAKSAIYAYIICLIFLLLVELVGDISKGAQRWLNIGFMRLQPSEFLKLTMPLTIAAFFAKETLPPRKINLIIAFFLLAIPTVLIALQPDLGTAILVATSGFIAIFLAGLSFWWIGTGVLLGATALPIMWNYVLHDYQKQRVLTFLNPGSLSGFKKVKTRCFW